jgi:uncharacterized surface protein with fasciclin (FAS1) repeats
MRSPRYPLLELTMILVRNVIMKNIVADLAYRAPLALQPLPQSVRPGIARRGLRAATAFAALFVVLGSLSATAKAGDILEVINQDPSYSKFSTLLRKAGVDESLKGGGVYTIFAPSNAAFDEMPVEERHRLFSTDSAIAREAISNLVVEKKYMPQDIAHNRVLLTTIGGQGVMMDGTEGRLTADGTEILSVDTSPSNGVIYTIDGVSLNQKAFDRDMD